MTVAVHALPLDTPAALGGADDLQVFDIRVSNPFSGLALFIATEQCAAAMSAAFPFGAVVFDATDMRAIVLADDRSIGKRRAKVCGPYQGEWRLRWNVEGPAEKFGVVQARLFISPIQGRAVIATTQRGDLPPPVVKEGMVRRAKIDAAKEAEIGPIFGAALPDAPPEPGKIIALNFNGAGNGVTALLSIAGHIRSYELPANVLVDTAILWASSGWESK